MEDIVNEFNTLREKHREQALINSQLLTQLNESMFALKEIELLEPDAKIYKSTGPILAIQCKEDAVNTISKRLEYIRGEMDTNDKKITSLQSKIEEIHKKIEAIKQQIPAPDQSKS